MRLFALLLIITLLGPTNAILTDDLWCPFDPFHYLRNEPPPQCSLTPPPIEPSPQSEFLSFEEWKARQQAIAEQQTRDAARPGDVDSAPVLEDIASSHQDGVGSEPAAVNGSGSAAFVSVSHPKADVHVRVPLTDRFNYASLDCSARIHTSHKLSKSSYHILSSKKDKYMLSPCTSPDKFVVVELCDDIQIDTVQLANFEFFSGVFKDFKVSVAQTYSSDPDDWVDVGTYRAKNLRSLQSFHPIHQDFKFYRYIRIDFLSHYGAEYYCPVSLLRVYGLTQMEEYKWEEWQAAWTAERARSIAAESEKEKERESQSHGEKAAAAAERSIQSHISAASQEITTSLETESNSSTAISLPTSETTLLPSATAFSAVQQQSILSTLLSFDVSDVAPTGSASSSSSLSSSSPFSVEVILATPSLATTSSSENPPSSTSQASSQSEPASSSKPVDSTSSSASPITTSSSPTASTAISIVSSESNTDSVPSTIISQAAKPPPPRPSPNAGESIYRTIMNRLSILESNSSLGVRYVEEQMRTVRDALKRVEEEIGRLEGMSKVQQQVFQRTLTAMEKQKLEMEAERSELLSRVHILSDEVVLEKRLGIAQLTLLLIVLVFMAFTRGASSPSPSSTAIPRTSRPAEISPKPAWRPSKSEDLDATSQWRTPPLAKSPTPIPTSEKTHAKSRSRERSQTQTPHRSANPSPSPAPSRTPFQPHKQPFTLDPPPKVDSPLKRSRSQSSGMRKLDGIHTPKRSGKLAHLHEFGSSVRRRKISLISHTPSASGGGEGDDRGKEGEKENSTPALATSLRKVVMPSPMTEEEGVLGSDAWEDTSDVDGAEHSSPTRRRETRNRGSALYPWTILPDDHYSSRIVT